MSDQDKARARAIACDQLGCHMDYYRDRNAHVFGCDNLTAIVASALADVRAQERESCAEDTEADGIRDYIFGILTQVAADGLSGPRDLDVAADAIVCTFRDAIRASNETETDNDPR